MRLASSSFSRGACPARRAIMILTAVSGASFLSACATVKVEPIEVKEIHIVHDVNIKVDKQLDEFFAFQDQQPTTQHASPATQSTSSLSLEGEIR